LSAAELYEILALRQEVFVVEQNCPYQDCDDKDLDAWHLTGRDENGRLICYTRLLPEGVSYTGIHIYRPGCLIAFCEGYGAGRQLMEESIKKCVQLFGNQPIKIGAQTYLLKFYESFGFRSTGEEYLEDGIPHTSMILADPTAPTQATLVR
jgi:ElaA protein